MKTKIETLTLEQIARFPEFVDRWMKIGLSTEPADRPRAEAGIRMAYEAAGLAPPTKIVWCGSPLSQGLTRAILRSIGSKEIAEKVRDSVKDSVKDSVWDSVKDSVKGSVWDSVWNSVWDSVKGSVEDSVEDSVKGSVWDSVWNSVEDSVWDSVWDSVKDSVKGSVWDSVWNSVWDSAYGSHDAGWLCFYDYFREAIGLDAETQKLNGLTEVAKSAGWFLPFKTICFVSERHNKLNRDTQGRIHCENGPAIEYPDGWQIHAWHGIRVAPWIIEKPQLITVDKIKAEQNSEIRRVMVERYGAGKYLLDSGAKVLNSDKFGILYKQDDIVCVRVLNSTPEPDGVLLGSDALKVFAKPSWWRPGFEKMKFKEYFLDVHPELRPLISDAELGAAQKMTARNAVASTFGLRGEEYAPMEES